MIASENASVLQDSGTENVEAYMQVSIKFVSNLDEFGAEQRFYSSIPTSSGNNLGAFVPRLHDTIIGSNTTWSGEHHPPAFVLERGHFSLEVPPAFCPSFFFCDPLGCCYNRAAVIVFEKTCLACLDFSVELYPLLFSIYGNRNKGCFFVETTIRCFA